MRKTFIAIIILLAAWNAINTISILKLNSGLVKTFVAASKQDSIILRSVYRDLSKILDLNIKQTKTEYEYIRASK